ncbi:MAG: alpha/beta hydrolase [Patescibacteria group bacterium]|nr:alpha/beta hydrolase [Patescibacteria group bacterium]
MKKRIIVVHGCPSSAEGEDRPETRTYDKHWIPWLKEELVARGILVEIPLMPLPWQPSYERFREEFAKHKVDEDSILVGHSCGCSFLVRWLGETKAKVAKLILVAPWKIPDKNNKYDEEFYDYNIDTEIKSRVEKIIMFTSDDEELEGKESLHIFNKVLGGRVIELKGRGHYISEDMGTNEFPELLQVILE